MELDTKIPEASAPELPGEMFGRVLENMAVATFAWQAEVVEQLLTANEIDDISEPVQVWCRAQQHAAWPKDAAQPGERDIARHGQMLDHLGEEDHIELLVRGWIVDGQIPDERVDPMLPEPGEAAVLDICHTGTVSLPQPHA